MGEHVDTADRNGSRKHSKVSVHRQNWTWTEIVLWTESNSDKQVRPLHTEHPSPSLHSSPSLASGNVGQTLSTDILPVSARHLMSCNCCRNCQMFLCIFTKPISNWKEKNVTCGFTSKKNTVVLVVLGLSVQVKSSHFSESCKQCYSGPINLQ